MPRRRKQTASPSQTKLLDIAARLRTGPCVPALREAVKAWKAGGYKGITDTTRILLNHWFHTDHRLATGMPFHYHASQQEAIETLIFVWEYEKVRSRKVLLERYAQDLRDLRLPPYDDFARYCIKMATGSGKTKVMALAVAWQFLNAARESEKVAKDYAKTFLVLAPNVIVFDRLKIDFAGGRIFRADPVIPKELEIFWDFDCVMRGEAEKAHAEGTLFLTNIQQFYERPDRSAEEEPNPMTSARAEVAKLPRAFGFAIEYTDAAMNLRNYEPDFVAVDSVGTHWLLESKGQETIDVLRKDAAAARWCENATKLTGKEWKYIKVPQKDYEALRPNRLADLAALQPVSLF